MKNILILSILLISLHAAAQNQNLKKVETCDFASLSEMKGNDELRVKVAAENSCSIKDVKFLRFSKTKNVGMYTLCVAGKIVKYKQIGKTFTEIE